MSTLADPDPTSMSNRARIYIAASAARHFLVGLSLLVMPWLYSAAAFIPIFGALPRALWGWVMVVTGILGTIACFTRLRPVARLSIGISATVTTVLGVGVTIGLVNQWILTTQVIGSTELLNLIVEHPAVFPAHLAAMVVAPPSPFLALLLLSVSVKDFTMCAQPMRVPIEDYYGVVKLKDA